MSEETQDDIETPIYLPLWEAGVPYCREECCQYEDGVCRIMEKPITNEICIAVIPTMTIRKIGSEERTKWAHERLNAWKDFAAIALHASLMISASAKEEDPSLGKLDVVGLTTAVAKEMLEEWDRTRVRIFQNK